MDRSGRLRSPTGSLPFSPSPCSIPASPLPPQARELGRAAERRATWHLRLRGWRIAARNWIGGGGELDIVASRWKTLLVVEVRSRAAPDAALASIDDAKMQRTLSAARSLVHTHGLQRYRLRVDLIGFDASGRLVRRRDVLSPR